MFIASKKAYLDMNDFLNSLTKKINILKLDKYLEEFFNSNSYSNLMQMAK